MADVAFNKDPAAVMTVKKEQMGEVSEYGFGFWLRWLSRHPVAVLKRENWHFVARLTTNDQHRDIQMGDRTLAVFLGTDGYYFFSNDEASKSNPQQKIDLLPDIEGVWTFVYFNYNRVAKRAVAFLRYLG